MGKWFGAAGKRALVDERNLARWLAMERELVLTGFFPPSIPPIYSPILSCLGGMSRVLVAMAVTPALLVRLGGSGDR